MAHDTEKVRLVYTTTPQDVFPEVGEVAVIGPFNGSDKHHDLQLALETFIANYNRFAEGEYPPVQGRVK